MEDKNNNSINSLPEYKIRTMQGDIDKLEKEEILPPDELPIIKIETPPKPLDVNLKAPIKPIEIPKAPLKPLEIIPKPIEVSAPSADEPLKSVDIRLEPIEPPAPKIVEISKPQKIETPKPKSSLPEIEDFIVVERPEKEKIVVVPEAPVKVVLEKPTIKEMEIEQLKTENIFETEQGANRKKFWLIVLLAILAMAIILGFFYWRGLKTESNPNNSTPQPLENELKIPDSLITVDEVKILKLENNISFLILLQDEKISALKTIRRIVPTKISPESGKEEVLSLSDLIKELNISVYPYVLSEFKNNYTLVLYGQEENEKRFGLIIETTNNINLKEQLHYWEKTMIENLYNIFLGKQPQIPTNKNFSDGVYNIIPIRFINFPNPDISIDYSTPNNLFILSTSRESMHTIIDRIK